MCGLLSALSSSNRLGEKRLLERMNGNVFVGK